KVDALNPQALEAAFESLAQHLGPTVHLPAVRTGALVSALGGNHQPVIRIERLTQQFFTDIGTVGLSGVDEIHVEIAQLLQRPDRLAAILRGSPDALAGDAHGPKTQAVDLEIATDGKRTGKRG